MCGNWRRKRESQCPISEGDNFVSRVLERAVPHRLAVCGGRCHWTDGLARFLDWQYTQSRTLALAAPSAEACIVG